MWTMKQIKEAFKHFKEGSPSNKSGKHADAEELDVWWRDEALCVFKTAPPEEMPEEHRVALEELGWIYEPDGNEYGDPCWYLFRSD